MEDDISYDDALELAITEIQARCQARLYRAAVKLDPAKELDEDVLEEVIKDIRSTMSQISMLKFIARDELRDQL